MNAITAAATLAECSGWSLSNLQIQKLLYIAQMFHMGEHEGAPIFNEDFQAWKLGPVLPNVYHTAKMYGSKPVKNLFWKKRLAEGSTEREMVERVVNEVTDKRPWNLVAITHWENGAWAKHYSPDGRNLLIPKTDIWQEYRDRS